MDNVQFPKTGGTWTNRVKLLINGSAAWVTLPVVRNYSGTRMISEMQINNTTNWREKLIKTLQINYGRAPHYRSTIPVIEALVYNPTDSVADFNMAAIRSLCELLSIDTSKLVRGCELDAEDCATDLLISMTKGVGGTAYMCGGGADGYQEDEKFSTAGIGLMYQKFIHPVYRQAGSDVFVPGLSLLDALFSCGRDEVIALLENREADR
jgi:hypothetical protein